MADLAKPEVQGGAAVLANAASTFFATFDLDSAEARKLAYNATTASESLSDHIGEKINLVHVLAQNVELEDMNNPGVMNQAVRVILIDDKNRAFGTVSSGVLNSVQQIIGIMGHPSTWEKPLTVKASKKRGRKGFEFTTLEIV